jgi:hypothetical protein
MGGLTWLRRGKDYLFLRDRHWDKLDVRGWRNVFAAVAVDDDRGMVLARVRRRDGVVQTYYIRLENLGRRGYRYAVRGRYLYRVCR